MNSFCLQAFTFHGIACCVTHLYVRKSRRQQTVNCRQNFLSISVRRNDAAIYSKVGLIILLIILTTSMNSKQKFLSAKNIIVFAVLTILLFSFSLCSKFDAPAISTPPAVDTIQYTESAEDFPNPDRGFYRV